MTKLSVAVALAAALIATCSLAADDKQQPGLADRLKAAMPTISLPTSNGHYLQKPNFDFGHGA
jgi:hypothetical protein